MPQCMIAKPEGFEALQILFFHLLFIYFYY